MLTVRLGGVVVDQIGSGGCPSANVTRPDEH